jgi:putative tricarboxylic transport membrane protein
VLDIWLALAAGAVGAVMRFSGFPIAPMVIGMVLSPMIEQSLRQGLVITRGSFLAFFERPIALTLILLTVGVLLWPIIRMLRERHTGRGAS